MTTTARKRLPRASPAAAPTGGAVQGLQGPTFGRASQGGPRLPHERDQGLGHVASEPDPLVQQAAKDLADGQVDTDLRSTPGLDAQRRAELVAGHANGQSGPQPAARRRGRSGRPGR